MSCLTNLLSFYDQVTCQEDEGKSVNMVYLVFSEGFDSLSVVKLAIHCLDRHTLCWLKKRLGVWTQRVLLNGDNAVFRFGSLPVTNTLSPWSTSR